MKKNLLIIAIIFVFLTSGYIFFQFFLADYFISKGSLSVTTNTNTTVFLNDKEVGKNPYQGQKVNAKDYHVKLVSETPIASTAADTKPSATQTVWESSIGLAGNTQVVINQEVGPATSLTAGEVLSLEKGEGITVIAKPEGTEVSLDEGGLSPTPASLEASVGTHKLKLSKSGYYSRELTVNVPSGYRLVINAQLALNPLESQQEAEKSEKVTLYQFSTDEATLLADPQSWAAGIWYFQEKQPDKPRMDAILDGEGKVYYASVAQWQQKEAEKKEVKLGYLANKANPQLSEAAKKKYEEIKNAFVPPKPKVMVKILPTPTGWLRVRAGAGLNHEEVAKVNQGESYELLEEASGWSKIKLSDGKEGWVSSQYASKQ
jgi:hypothetical protein